MLSIQRCRIHRLFSDLLLFRSVSNHSSALFILGTTGLCAAIGLPFGGLLGALAGGLAGICVAMAADAVIKARRSGRLVDGPAILIAGLSTQQKFAVLGQGLGGGAIDFRPKALQEAIEVESLAKEDLEAGLRAAKALEEQYAQVPTVSVVHARLALKAEQHERAAQAASRALERATRGGMNSVAVEILIELPKAIHEQLALTRVAWGQLGRALLAARKNELASWAQGREGEVDPEEDARRHAESMRRSGQALREREAEEKAPKD